MTFSDSIGQLLVHEVVTTSIEEGHETPSVTFNSPETGIPLETCNDGAAEWDASAVPSDSVNLFCSSSPLQIFGDT